MLNFKITWEKVITNVFSSLILCIVGGAAMIVWNGATTVESKVDNATASIKLQQDYLGKAILVIEKEIVDIKEQLKDNKTPASGGSSSGSDPKIPTPESEITHPSQLPPLPVHIQDKDKIPNDLIRQQLPEQKTL